MESSMVETRRASSRIANRRQSIVPLQNISNVKDSETILKYAEYVSKNSPIIRYAKDVLNSLVDVTKYRTKRERPLESFEEIKEFYEKSRKKFKPSELLNSLETIYEEPVVRNGTTVVFGNRKLVRKLNVEHKTNKSFNAKIKARVQKIFGKGRPKVQPIPMIKYK